MQETPENTGLEPAQNAEKSRERPSPWLRVLMLAALLATGIVIGAVAMSVVRPPPVTQTTAKPPRVVKPSTRATQAAPAKVPVEPAPPVIESATVMGQVADEFGRAIVDAVVLVGRDRALEILNGTETGVGELGVTDGPVPPIPDGTVIIAPRDAMTARTDQDGKFSIAGIAPGNAQIFVSQPGYEPNALAVEGLRAGETRDKLYIVLRTPAEVTPVEQVAAADPNLARIAGVVLDVLGRPVAQALVETDEGESSTRTDANGAFELVNVAPGALQLIASDLTAGRAESPEVRARAGELLPGVRVHLPGRHVPRPSVTEPAPKPPASVATRSATQSPPVKAAPSVVLQAGVALEQRANSVVVSLVDQNSAAAAAGLLAGDALLRVDAEPVLSASQARGMLRDPAGVLARVQILRGKKRLTLRWKRPGARFAPSP